MKAMIDIPDELIKEFQEEDAFRGLTPEQVIAEIIDNAFELPYSNKLKVSTEVLTNVHGVPFKKLGLCNVEVSLSPNEVRLWACDPKKGESVFRIKAWGKVYSSDTGAVIMQEK